MRPTALQVVWNECPGRVPCRLFQLDLMRDRFPDVVGVFVIFLDEERGRATVLIGHGRIRDELLQSKKREDIMQYGSINCA